MLEAPLVLPRTVYDELVMTLGKDETARWYETAEALATKDAATARQMTIRLYRRWRGKSWLG